MFHIWFIWAWKGLVMMINGQAEDRINTVINMSSVCRGARSQISVWREQCSQGNTSYHHLYTYWTSLLRMLMLRPSQLLWLTNCAVSGACTENNESFFMCTQVLSSNFTDDFYPERLKNKGSKRRFLECHRSTIYGSPKKPFFLV